MNNKRYSDTKKPTPRLRQLIITKMLDQAREDFIRVDIEMSFLKQLQEKIHKGEVALEAINPCFGDIDNHVKSFKTNHTFSLERFLYLKKLRDASRDEKDVRKAEKEPETVEVEYCNK